MGVYHASSRGEQQKCRQNASCPWPHPLHRQFPPTSLNRFNATKYATHAAVRVSQLLRQDNSLSATSHWLQPRRPTTKHVILRLSEKDSRRISMSKSCKVFELRLLAAQRTRGSG